MAVGRIYFSDSSWIECEQTVTVTAAKLYELAMTGIVFTSPIQSSEGKKTWSLQDPGLTSFTGYLCLSDVVGLYVSTDKSVVRKFRPGSRAPDMWERESLKEIRVPRYVVISEVGKLANVLDKALSDKAQTDKENERLKREAKNLQKELADTKLKQPGTSVTEELKKALSDKAQADKEIHRLAEELAAEKSRPRSDNDRIQQLEGQLHFSREVNRKLYKEIQDLKQRLRDCEVSPSGAELLWLKEENAKLLGELGHAFVTIQSLMPLKTQPPGTTLRELLKQFLPYFGREVVKLGDVNAKAVMSPDAVTGDSRHFPVLEAQEANWFFKCSNHHIACFIGTQTVLAQGLNWSRYASDDGSKTNLMHNRNVGFWDPPQGLKLTQKGFVRLYRSKSEKWRVYMARAMGQSLKSADAEYFHGYVMDDSLPDLTPIVEDHTVNKQRIRLVRMKLDFQPSVSPSSSQVTFGTVSTGQGVTPGSSTSEKGKPKEKKGTASKGPYGSTASPKSSISSSYPEGFSKDLKAGVAAMAARLARKGKEKEQKPRARSEPIVGGNGAHLVGPVSPETSGYCYLRLFMPEDTKAAADELGLWPRVGKVLDALEKFGWNPAAKVVFSVDRSCNPEKVHVSEGEAGFSPVQLEYLSNTAVCGGSDNAIGQPPSFVTTAKSFLTNGKWLRNGLDMAAASMGRVEPTIPRKEAVTIGPSVVMVKENKTIKTPRPKVEEPAIKVVLDKDHAPVVYPRPDYISPFEDGRPLPGRQEAWVSGWEITKLRHPEESPSLRSTLNPGMHGLPSDFLESYPRMPGQHYRRLLAIWRQALGLIATFEWGDNPSTVIEVTANRDWQGTNTCINFISDESRPVGIEPREDGGCNVFVPTRGVALRSIRLIPNMIPLDPKFNRMLFLNGRIAEYEKFGFPTYNPAVPMPQTSSFYVESTGMGRNSMAPGYLIPYRKSWFNYLVHTATIYGAEEFILSTLPSHNQLYPPPRWGRKTAFGCWGKNYEFNAERWWYDENWVMKDHRTHHDLEALKYVSKLCRRNPIEERQVVSASETARAFQRSWKVGVLIATVTVFCTCNLTQVIAGLKGIDVRNPVWFALTLLVPAFFGLLLGKMDKQARKKRWNDDEITLVHGDDEWSEDPGSTLFIPTMGTHGDHVPPRFFANIAVLMGVKTHLHKLQTATHSDLANLKEGKLYSLVPGWLQNNYNRLRGYKAVFNPHIDLDMPNSASYTLAPPRSYINKIKYMTDEGKKNAPFWDHGAVWFAELLAESFTPTFKIGCLKGCSLPRSANGVSPIEKKANLKTGQIGWLHGSASEEVIPEWIRLKFPKVPNGDHNEIFRYYDTIHMPGGAGAVQTAIACGATPVIHDVNLDRDYHKLPTQADFHQPSVLPFLGWLKVNGFALSVPWFVSWAAVVTYVWHSRSKVIWSCGDTLLRLSIFYWFGCTRFLVGLAIVLIMPTFLQRYALGMVTTDRYGLWTLKVIWRYPFMMVTKSWLFPVIALISMRGWFWQLTQDGLNFCDTRFELFYEPVQRGKVCFWFPFGHWGLRDTSDMSVVEGKFKTPGKNCMGDAFALVKSQRPLKKGARTFPAPFHAIRLFEGAETKPYGPTHNCTTIILNGLAYRSVISYVMMLLVAGATYCVLKPPQHAAWLYNRIYPEGVWEESTVYKALGFAGEGRIPVEHDDEYFDSIDISSDVEEEYFDAESQLPEVEQIEIDPVTKEGVTVIEEIAPQHQDALDWARSDDSIADISHNINYLLGLIKDIDLPRDEKVNLAERVYLRLLEDLPNHIPEANDVTVLTMPNWKPKNFEELIDATHRVLSQVLDSRLVKSFCDWLKGLGHNLLQVIWPILEKLVRAMGAAYKISKVAARRFYHVICHWLDAWYGGSAPKRVKTVWGLTGLTPNGLVGQKARLAQAMTMMDYPQRGQFLDDYGDFVSNIKEKATGLKGCSSIGGPQRRNVRFSKPLMSHEEAKILGFEPGEYVTDQSYQDRVEGYLREGIPQAVDGVLFGTKNPKRIDRSIRRYEPEYETLSAVDAGLMEDVADAMFEKWPEVFADRDIMPLNGVEAYIKIKYSPGAPFIGSNYTSRKALKEAGVMDLIKKNALAAIESGVYPTQFYHAFAKSQAVNGEALLPPRMKDLRTVVSQDIPSYFVDQIFQIEGNKRLTWETYGAGSGMPLTQAMDRIFEEFADLKALEGGQFIVADAFAYDSKVKPAPFHAAAKLYDLGFKNHPSGVGAMFSKVIRCKYEAMQNAWIFGITEPSYDSLVIGCLDRESRHELERRYPKHFCSFEQFCTANGVSLQDWGRLSLSEQGKKSVNMEIPGGKVLLTYHPCIQPRNAHWQGAFTLGNKPNEFMKHQTYFYSSKEQLMKDITRVVLANRDVISNVHYKNRGGGTGQSATSWDNTVTFKAGVIGAWSRATGRTPKDFFKTNRLFNTSDDTVWWSKDLLTSAEVDRFKQAASEFGIMLEIGSTKKITEVEYLSKLPRTPTKEDSADYKAWRQGRLEQISRANNLTPSQRTAFEAKEMPRFMIVQNPTAIMLRRTAFRYYQSSQGKFLYTLCERGAGHALVTAFQPSLYKKFAIEACEDMNRLCEQQKINQHWVLKDQEDRQKMRVEQVNPNWKVGYKATPRQEAFLRWQKQARFPSYARVLDTHLRIKDPDPLAHEKFLAKLDKAWKGNDEFFRDIVDALYKGTNEIPEEIKRFMPSVDMLYAENPWYTKNQYIEKFIYLKALESFEVDTMTFADFDAIARESPYGVCMNTVKFWEDCRDPEFVRDILDNHGNVDKVRVYQALTICISLLYFSMHWIELMIQTIFIIGPLYNMFMWTFWGLAKVYGLANTTYWHSRARSSREISSIMPRDPYLWSKRFVCSIADFLPEKVGLALIPLTWLFDGLAEVVELVFGRVWRMCSNIKSVGPGYGNTIAGAPNNVPLNPWLAYAHDYARQAIKCGRVTVAARTASGKSTWFPSAVWTERKSLGIEKLWILMPRKILVKEWEIPFQIRTQKVRRGVVLDPTADIYVTTYGHFLRRVGNLTVGKNLVFFDEFHEMNGFMLQGVEQWKGATIFMSATPVVLHGLDGIPFLEPNMPRRHPLKVYKVDTDDVADMWLRAKNQFSDQPKVLQRPMVVVPTYKEVEKAIAGLQYLDKSVTWTEVSRKQPMIPKSGGMVCTPYVQTGLDIKPPPTILIDSGRDVVIDKGQLVLPHPYTDDKTNEQRINRVGRIMEGVVIQPTLAGSGKKPLVYPTGIFFQSELVAKQYNLPQLTPINNYIHDELKFLGIDWKSDHIDEKTRRLEEVSVRKSLLFIHLMALNGVPRKEWQRRYVNYFDLRLPLTEDEDHLERILSGPVFNLTPHLPVNRAMQLLHGNHVTWGIGGVPTRTLPLFPIQGQWQSEPGGVLRDYSEKKLVHHAQDRQVNQWQIENIKLRKEVDTVSRQLALIHSKLRKFKDKSRFSSLLDIVAKTNVKVAEIEAAFGAHERPEVAIDDSNCFHKLKPPLLRT
jgi:hypothetical protein